MKKTLTIVLFFISLSASAQKPAVIADTITTDTVPMLIPVLDTSHYYDVYSSTGAIVRRNANELYKVPTGGYRVKLGLINNNRQFLEGYEVYKTRSDFSMVLIARLNYLKKLIQPPFIIVGAGVPVNGF